MNKAKKDDNNSQEHNYTTKMKIQLSGYCGLHQKRYIVQPKYFHLCES
jgi:hypothetical protein